MTIHFFGDEGVFLQVDTEKHKIKLLSRDDKEACEKIHQNKCRQHIVRLKDDDVLMIGHSLKKNGYEWSKEAV